MLDRFMAGEDDGLRKRLQEGSGTSHPQALADWVGSDPARFDRLIAHATSADAVLAARAIRAAGFCLDRHPAWLAAHLDRLLDALSSAHAHRSLPRFVLRALSTAPLPAGREDRILSVAFSALSGTAGIAAQAYAVTVMKRFSADSPELRAEARRWIEELLPDASAAVRSRARRDFGIGRRG